MNGEIHRNISNLSRVRHTKNYVLGHSGSDAASTELTCFSILCGFVNAVVTRIEVTTIDEFTDVLSREASISDVMAALHGAHRKGVALTSISPATVLFILNDGYIRASLAGWGREHAVTAALDDTIATPYTTPEQLSQTWEDTTPVSQLGTLAYRLLCHTALFRGKADLEQAIREGALTDPSMIADVPPADDTMVRQAMAPAPAQRYATPATVTDRLTEIFE